MRCLQNVVMRTRPPGHWSTVIGQAFYMLTAVRELSHVYSLENYDSQHKDTIIKFKKAIVEREVNSVCPDTGQACQVLEHL